jgi:hypothetical protein
MQMKQPTTVREAKSMVKERWLDRRVEKLSKENDELRAKLSAAPLVRNSLTLPSTGPRSSIPNIRPVSMSSA